MRKLANKFLMWYYRRSLAILLGWFWDDVKEMGVVIAADELNRRFKIQGWSNKHSTRVFRVAIHLGIIERCDHPIFNKRIAYWIKKDLLK